MGVYLVSDFDFISEVIFKSNVQVSFTNKYKELVEGFLNPAKDERRLTQLIQASLLFAYKHLSEFEGFSGFDLENDIIDNKKILDAHLREYMSFKDKLEDLKSRAMQVVVEQNDKAVYEVIYGLINLELVDSTVEVTEVGHQEDINKGVLEEAIKGYIDNALSEYFEKYSKMLEGVSDKLNSLDVIESKTTPEVSIGDGGSIGVPDRETTFDSDQDTVKSLDDIVIDTDEDFGSDALTDLVNSLL